MSATRVIKVPDVGEGVAEVELVTWHVRPGDAVAEDQALAEVMTDKAVSRFRPPWPASCRRWVARWGRCWRSAPS